MKRKRVTRSMRIAKGEAQPSGKSKYARKVAQRRRGIYNPRSPFGPLQREIIRLGLADIMEYASHNNFNE